MGEQTEAGEKKPVSFIPSRARASRLGVVAEVGPPKQAMSCQEQSSEIKMTMLGREAWAAGSSAAREPTGPPASPLQLKLKIAIEQKITSVARCRATFFCVSVCMSPPAIHKKGFRVTNRFTGFLPLPLLPHHSRMAPVRKTG